MRLTVGKKLIGSFLAIALLVLISGIVTITQLQSVNRTMNELTGSWLPATAAAGKIDTNISNLQRLLNRHLFETNPDALEKVEQEIVQRRGLVTQAFDRYRPTLSQPADRALFSRIEAEYGAYLVLLDRTLQISQTGNKAEAVRHAQAKTIPHYQGIKDEVNQLIVANEQGVLGASQHAEEVLKASRQNSLWAIALVMVIGMALGLWHSRQITVSVKRIGDAAEGISRGELDQRLDVTSHDEFGDMARTFTRMTAYLEEVASVAEGMSHGDFTRTVTPKSERDQFGVAISKMIANLRTIVGRVRAASESVGTGAEQLSGSSSELSATVSQQAASSEETSATIVEMTASIRAVDQSAQVVLEKVKQLEGESHQLGDAVSETSRAIAELAASIQQVAGNVAHASQVSDRAAKAANDGESAVAQTIGGITTVADTMTAIQNSVRHLQERSGEIGRIIEVIDDIAEQTNLLALNAAIEAARAGEAGRGFAVVADEVRKLAERCAHATQEIGTLIKGVQAETKQAAEVSLQGSEQAKEGVELATVTGDVLRQLKAAAGEVNALMRQVASATDEQTRASAQIVASAEQMGGINRHLGDAVAEMNQATQTVTYATGEQRTGCAQVVAAVEQQSRSAQESAAATEQVARTADDLKLQATRLQEAMAFFKTGQAERFLEIGIARSAERLLT
ncbi:MAG TPA: methyl-accepting chemotaxis protein [Pantanalinema sp.]